jgi:hypothetical protein
MAGLKSNQWGITKPPAGASVNWGDPISNQLAARWLFNESTVNRLVDIARNFHGTIIAGVRSVGKFGKSLSFNGTTAYIDFLNSSRPILPATRDWTFSAWVRPESVNIVDGNRIFSQYIATTGVAGHGRMFITITSTGFWALFLGSTASLGTVAIVTTSAAALNAWTHLACTRRGNEFRMYVNGVDVGLHTDASTRSILQTGNLIGVSGNDAATYNAALIGRFVGRIDNAGVHYRALGATEIRRLYEEPFAGIVAPRMHLRSSPAAAVSNAFIYIGRFF